MGSYYVTKWELKIIFTAKTLIELRVLRGKLKFKVG